MAPLRRLLEGQALDLTMYQGKQTASRTIMQVGKPTIQQTRSTTHTSSYKQQSKQQQQSVSLPYNISCFVQACQQAYVILVLLI